MQYVVIARWLEGKEWQTREREFNDLEAAEMWKGIKSDKLTFEVLNARHEKEETERSRKYLEELPMLRKIWADAEKARIERELQEERAFEEAVRGMCGA